MCTCCKTEWGEAALWPDRQTDHCGKNMRFGGHLQGMKRFAMATGGRCAGLYTMGLLAGAEWRCRRQDAQGVADGRKWGRFCRLLGGLEGRPPAYSGHHCQSFHRYTHAMAIQNLSAIENMLSQMRQVAQAAANMPARGDAVAEIGRAHV